MQERAGHFGGSVVIGGAPGQGTLAATRMPLPATEPTDEL